MKTLFLTGCAGFIGANFVKKIASRPDVKSSHRFVILDALTYAGRYQTIQEDVEGSDHLSFHKLDIRDAAEVSAVFREFKPDGLIHFAAESHVDRSIDSPKVFVETNCLGTLNLLNAALERGSGFRFTHISTDEVYGTLGEEDAAFTEGSPLAPNSPYSASKASSDMLVRSYVETFGLDAVITRCSNNYGPYQFPEKLIPLMIHNAQKGIKLPVYGDGRNIRDWIFVDDHNAGVWLAHTRGRKGEVYNFGGASEKRNVEVVRSILKLLGKPESLIEFVTDRKGHDWRYAINFAKAEKELGWKPTLNFEKGLALTAEWYNSHQSWLRMIEDTRQ